MIENCNPDLNDIEVKNYINKYLREYFTDTISGEQNLYDQQKHGANQVLSELIKDNLLRKVNILKQKKILPENITYETLADYLINLDGIKLTQSLKKIEVAFGDDSYRKQLYFGTINTKNLTSYLGYSKPKVNEKLKNAESDKDDDSEDNAGFVDEDDENDSKGLIALWRFDENILPKIEDTSDMGIKGTVHGEDYSWEDFRGDNPMEEEDKWGKTVSEQSYLQINSLETHIRTEKKEWIRKELKEM